MSIKREEAAATSASTPITDRLVGSVMCISVIEHFVTSFRAPVIVLGFFETTISAIKVF